MYPGFGPSMFGRPEKDAMMKDQLAVGLYGPAATPTNIYGLGVQTVQGIQGLSGLHQAGSRVLSNTPQMVSRCNTTPGNFAASNLGVMPQLGAPSPPTAAGRTGMLPLGSGRASLMSTGQGLVAPKPRPSNLSSAIGSALPVNPFGSLGRTSQGMMSPISAGYNSAFSETTNQSGFDPSEFPLLGLGRSRHDNNGNTMMVSSGPLGRHNFTGYKSLSLGVGSEDRESPEIAQDNKFPVTAVSSTLPEYRSTLPYDPAPGANKERSNVSTPIGPAKNLMRKSYQPTTVSIPSGMVQDQFGMIGLLTFIRGAETDPSLVALALGSDLTTLGLNLNSPDNLYNTFASPWADSPCRPQDIDCSVPQEYLIYPYIRDKLAYIRLHRYHDDLLFYLYYSNGGDVMQVMASCELFNRDWRYHKEERLWITRAPGMKPTKQESSYEEGTYCFFDMQNWRKAHKEFRVEYDKLEDRPQVPPNVSPGIQHGSQTNPAAA